jgi:protein TonB
VDYAQTQRNPGKHVVGFSVVLVLHLLLGWALINGLAQRLVEVIKAPLETKIIEEVKPPPPPPPPENLPPPPKFAPPPPSFVPPPEVNVNPPPMAAPTITTTTVAPPPRPVTIQPPAPPAPPAPAPPAPPRAAARPVIANAGACAPSSDDYPSAARRAEATGITKVRFTVGADGKLVGAEVVKSAGPSREHKMLDRVAVSKLSECSFKAGIDENGRPMGASFEVDYVWKLE